TPVAYTPGSFYAPDAGRNIFAFYEPPQPTPFVAQPIVETPIPTPPTPTPVPPPPLLLSYVSPQNIYAGSAGFPLSVHGDKFTPDTLIFWNGSQIPTTFVSPQQLRANIPANFIAGDEQRSISIEVRTPDGKLFSAPSAFSVVKPPMPTVQYIGVEIARRGNNNVAYFREPGNPMEFGRRLGDLVNLDRSHVNGRFRVVSISEKETVLEDTDLRRRYKVQLLRAGSGGGGGGQVTPSRGGFDRTNPGGRFPTDNQTVQPYNPTMPQTQEIPGIPNNIPRYVPPTPQQQKKDEDDDEDGDN
ncbi:MAG TPA: IPT/TIG domain-containing protein, partial [Pyrinomonadaceae bacterium]|nr:IPT/TIG domain-containing protein [Pyrinomonadaceae bacterium]